MLKKSIFELIILFSESDGNVNKAHFGSQQLFIYYDIYLSFSRIKSFIPFPGRPLTPRGENGKPKLNEELQTRQWSDRVIRKEKRRWKVRAGYVTKEVQVVVTPKVREEVRKHYGCDTLSGAELEDQGEEGTALTHWEKRLFEVGYL